MKSKLIANAAVAAAFMIVPVLGTVPAAADVIDWTTWSNTYTPGYPTGGSASGTMGGVNVTYLGEVLSVVANYPSWTPATSYVGGIIGNPPPQSGGIVQLQGGSLPPPVDTITFSTPVTNPVMAIWSLGQGGVNAQFSFNDLPIFQAGGPSAEYGGSAINVVANVVNGQEGNGTILFLGTFTQISWINPTFEYWYGFTVGAAETTPLPAALPLFASGLVGMWAWGRRRKLRAA